MTAKTTSDRVAPDDMTCWSCRHSIGTMDSELPFCKKRGDYRSRTCPDFEYEPGTDENERPDAVR